MSSETETIRCDRVEGVLTITLSRPARLNAMTSAMRQELCDALDADDAVRAIVFTGDGRAFCAGFDLAEPATAGAASVFDHSHQVGIHAAGDDAAIASAERPPDGGGILALRLFACKKPLTAAVNGAAVGVGASLLLPMDVRIASSAARFGFVFSRRGIDPDACASWFLPRVVGISRALEWSLGGRVFDAAEALSGGLVREVCEPADLLARATAIAHDIADHTAPISVALTRRLMWDMLGAAHPIEAHRLESRAIASRAASADAAEGVAAFLDKRAPVFPCRISVDMPNLTGRRPANPSPVSIGDRS